MVGHPLAVESVKPVKSHLVRFARAAWGAESPFPKHPGCISGFLEQVRHCECVRRHGLLPLGLNLEIPAHRTVPGMQPGHERATGWSTHRCRRVMLFEKHPPFSNAVDVRRIERGLPIDAQIAIAKVISNDIDHIGFGGSLAEVRHANERKKKVSFHVENRDGFIRSGEIEPHPG